MSNKKIKYVVLILLLINIIIAYFPRRLNVPEILSVYLEPISTKPFAYLSGITYILHSFMLLILFFFINQESIQELLSYKNKKRYFNSKVVKNIWKTAMIYSGIMVFSVFISQLINVGFEKLLFFNFFTHIYMFYINNTVFLALVLFIYTNIKLLVANNDFGRALVVTIIFLIVNQLLAQKIFTIFRLIPTITNHYFTWNYYFDFFQLGYGIIIISLLYLLGLKALKGSDFL